MNTSLEQEIFKRGSTTYYFSSKFFPSEVREDVFRLYSFVRIADDYVDCIPAKTAEFKALRKSWEKATRNSSFDMTSDPKESVEERVIKNIVFVSRKYSFKQEWVESFFDSMQADLNQKQYGSIEDTLWYIYGSAEVIGLMMSKIMRLESKALEAARMQGRAMQFINFIRDIDEDNSLGRCYFPKSELKRFNLNDLSKETATQHPERFKDFIHFQLARHTAWQATADEGFKFIPRRLRIPLRTAVDMYEWTAREIQKDPFIVFDRKVKPRKRRVLLRAGQLFILDGR